MGSNNPHKVLIWLHGASQTNFLPSSILDGLEDNVRVIQPIMKDNWWGSPSITALDQYSYTSRSICGSKDVQKQYELENNTLPKTGSFAFYQRRGSFNDGLPSLCKLLLEGDYTDSTVKISKLIKKMALKTGSIQSIVVGGYS